MLRAGAAPFGNAASTPSYACSRFGGSLQWSTEVERRRAALLDPEAWLRQALGAAARASARAARASARLELEAACDTTRRRLVQRLAAVRERSLQLLERVRQLFLGHTELARELVQPLGVAAAQRLGERPRQ